jgi:prepilin-type N-terminal cleavage/methylation domain-containing protein
MSAMPMGSRARRVVLRRRQSAGFTLVELMTVVAITGILAAVGVTLIRGHLNVAKANRALAGITALRAAEEAFRAENGTYLDCSGTTAKWYPMLVPGKVKVEWHQPDTHPDGARWALLPVTNTSPTQYGFLLNAGTPNTAYPILQTAQKPTLTPSPDPWYVIQVMGNLDGDEIPMLGLATSFNGEVYLEHEGE